MPDAAIIGPGAIGSVCAAWLSTKANDRTVLCAKTAIGELVVRTPSETLRLRPRVLVEPHRATPVDWILLATKAHQTQSTAPWFRSLSHASTAVAVLQNGVEHVERVRPLVGDAAIVPVVVGCPATRLEPGRVVQGGPATFIVPNSDDGQRFAALFQGTGIRVELTSDFVTVVWRKLCLNVAGAIPALTLKPIGIVHHPAVAKIMHGLITECIQVARAEGAELEPGLADEIIQRLLESPKDTKNSMLADRLAQKPLEIDARNGAVVRIGRRHGLSAPLNEWVTTLLSVV